MEIDYKNCIKNYVLYCVLCFTPALFCVEIPQDDTFPHFMEAIHKEDLDTFKELQSHVKDINRRGQEGMTPLLCSILEDSYPCFQLLLADVRIDVNTKGKKGLHPLLAAAIVGDPQMIEDLFAAEGINANAQDDFGSTALHGAVTRDRENIDAIDPVTELLAQRVKIDSKDENGNTPLMLAVLKRDLPIIRCLLHNGAHAFVVNNNGISSYSAAQGFEKIKKLLLKETFRQAARRKRLARFPKTQKDHSDSAHSVSYWKHPALDEERKMNSTDRALDRLEPQEKFEQFMKAIREGKLAEFKKLQPHVEDINQKDQYGMTPLLCSMHTNSYLCFKHLLDDGRIDANARGDKGLYPLLLAAVLGDLQMIQDLLSVKGIDVDAQDKYGFTALHGAVTRDRDNIDDRDSVVELLAQRVRIDIPNENGNTALMMAVLNEKKPAIEFLLRKGANPWREKQRDLNSFKLASEDIKFFMQGVVRTISREQALYEIKRIERIERIKRQQAKRKRVRDAISSLGTPRLHKVSPEHKKGV